MSILVIGDGPRDEKALPRLVCSLLGTTVQTRYDDLHQVRHLRGKGSAYARKLKYLTRRARADQFVALAIVVDKDKSPQREKLRDLRNARDEDRQKNAPFPTAIGEANPHFDVWLLDDAAAVREALKLTPEIDVPNAVRISEPKDHLSRLIGQSPICFPQISDAMSEVAQRLSLKRCAHAKKTGLATFGQDVQDEIKPVVSG